MKRIAKIARLLVALGLCGATFTTTRAEPPAARKALVFQSDFGVKDGAVSAMKGVATGVDADLKIYDLTHEIPAFNVWEGAYRLWQTAPYWPAGTVFVSVVDPGVGTARKSVVARAKNGQYFVTPDNGTLTLIAEKLGLEAVREIDEKVNRRPGSEESYTFHGRDVYAFTGARLAAGIIKFEEVGPELDAAKLVAIPYEQARAIGNGSTVEGGIPVLDPQYGNVWTNISPALNEKFARQLKPKEEYQVKIVRLSEEYLKARVEGTPWQGEEGTVVFDASVPFANSFGDVPEGKPLLYLNSLMQVSIALNQANFAAVHHVGSGPGWKVRVSRWYR